MKCDECDNPARVCVTLWLEDEDGFAVGHGYRHVCACHLLGLWRRAQGGFYGWEGHEPLVPGHVCDRYVYVRDDGNVIGLLDEQSGDFVPRGEVVYRE